LRTGLDEFFVKVEVRWLGKWNGSPRRQKRESLRLPCPTAAKKYAINPVEDAASHGWLYVMVCTRFAALRASVLFGYHARVQKAE
jgi:hypothetical protein